MVGGEAAASEEVKPGDASSSKKTYYVGTNALSVKRDGMSVVSTLNDGVIQDWDAAEAIVEHTYKSCLSCDPAEHPLLMAEPSFNPPAAREKMAEIGA